MVTTFRPVAGKTTYEVKLADDSTVTVRDNEGAEWRFDSTLRPQRYTRPGATAALPAVITSFSYNGGSITKHVDNGRVHRAAERHGAREHTMSPAGNSINNGDWDFRTFQNALEVLEGLASQPLFPAGIKNQFGAARQLLGMPPRMTSPAIG